MSKEHFTGENLAAKAGALARKLAAFISFKGCEIFFTERPLEEAELIARERCIISPVIWQGKQMGQLRLEQVDVRTARRLLWLLPQMVSLCLENIILEQGLHIDSRTGLLTGDGFLAQLAERLQPAGDLPPHERCFALLLASWQNDALIRQRAGGHTAATAWERMAAVLRDMLPPGATAAAMGTGEWRHEFAILFPGQGRGFCQGYGRKLLERLRAIEVIDPFSGSAVPLVFSAGHVLFPQDLSGADLHADAFSQALKLKDRARLAAEAAVQSGNGVLAYGWLLSRGGVIQELLSGNRVKITLGRNSQARVGMRFLVLPPGRTDSKGQIILRQIAASDAVGEILFLNDPENMPMPGDGLSLIHEEAALPGADILSQDAFNSHFNAQTRQLRQFVLSITRFSSGGDVPGALSSFLDNCFSSFESGMDNAITWGLYGPDGISIFWPHGSADSVGRFLEQLHESAAKNNLTAASGVAPYPFLDIGKGEVEAAALKALEYAQLLPPPNVGILDATALTISGDKRFSRNDSLGAVDEYRRALLLKPNDPLIMNSLGVSLAALNRMEAAVDVFANALAHCQDSSLRGKICYNLANIRQKENDLHAARHYYRLCLRADKAHVYAWLRLGQIAEMAGKIRAARVLYNRVLHMAGQEGHVAALAGRLLAKLETGASRAARARELLHDALMRDPNDSSAMLLLAEAYLEEDAAMAELLSRKALRLGAQGYEVLARALEAQGRMEEGRLARQRG